MPVENFVYVVESNTEYKPGQSLVRYVSENKNRLPSFVTPTIETFISDLQDPNADHPEYVLGVQYSVSRRSYLVFADSSCACDGEGCEDCDAHLFDVDLDQSTFEDDIMASVTSRPYLEGLFYREFPKLRACLEKLIDGNDITEAQRSAFIERLASEEGDLSAPQLLEWNDEIKDQFEYAIQRIEEATSAVIASDEINSALPGIVKQLRDTISAFCAQQLSKDTNTKQIQILAFKLDLINALRAHDQLFQGDHAWLIRRAVVNFLSFILTGGLLNVIRYASTNGRTPWFFDPPDAGYRFHQALEQFGMRSS